MNTKTMRKVLIPCIIQLLSYSTYYAQITKLHDFSNTSDGQDPRGSLISDGTYLYGMTSSGGAASMGCIFKVKPDGTGYSVLHFLSSISGYGYNPHGSLTSDGTFLYGTTMQGGANYEGTIFRIMPNGTNFSQLFHFGSQNGTIGENPYGTLHYDGNFLYGTTSSGGLYTAGTIFRIKTDGTEYTDIFDFSNSDVFGSRSSLTSDSTFLYGMAKNGGTFGSGAIFKTKKNGTDFSKIYDFSTGENPDNSLLLIDEVLYGMTIFGGNSDEGTVFKIKTDGSQYSRLYDFNILANGSNPYGSLIYDGVFLYGMTIDGGIVNGGCPSGCGIIFKIKPDGSEFSKVLDFTGISNGANPVGDLFYDGNDFFGMTYSGGNSADGVIFKLPGPIYDVWPGDSNNDFSVDNTDLLPIGLHFGQTGPVRMTINNTWQADSAANWSTQQLNINNIKHADCNGDGIISLDDTLAINLNFNSVHTFLPFASDNDSRQLVPQMSFVFDNEFYQAGDWVNAEILLGTSSTPVQNLYGIAFTIDYDAAAIQTGTESLNYLTNSWLGTTASEVIKFSKVDPINTEIYTAITRIDHINKNGYGKIADLKFKINTSLTSETIMQLAFLNVKAINSEGIIQPIQTQIDSILINQISGISETNSVSTISIYPNPFTDQTTIIFSKEQKNSLIKVRDALGREIKMLRFSGKQLLLEKDGMKPGIYSIEITDLNHNIANERIVIQ